MKFILSGLISLAALLSMATTTNGQQLQQTLMLAIQRNPALLRQIRSNHGLLQQLQLQKHISNQKLPPPHHQSQSQTDNQCLSLKKQNARLKQIIRAFTEAEDNSGGSGSGGHDFHSDPHFFNKEAVRSQRELNPAQFLLNQAVQQQQQQKPSISIQRVLVTPTPTWSTIIESSSYETVITTEVSTAVPILLRGNKVFTTITEETTQTATATEVKTSSTLITPSPTWDTVTVTIQPTKVQKSPSLPSLWPKPADTFRHVDPRTGTEYADVLEIDKGTSPTAAKTQLDRLKQAFFIASNAKRQQRNPIFEKDFDDFVGDFDQQVLAAQQRSVYVQAVQAEQKKSLSEPPSSTVKVFTLYFSGRVPGEYTTRLTTLTVGSDGKPVVERTKREAISPSRPEPIIMTQAPEVIVDQGAEILEQKCSSILEQELQGSFKTVTKTVTVTQTLKLDDLRSNELSSSR